MSAGRAMRRMTSEGQGKIERKVLVESDSNRAWKESSRVGGTQTSFHTADTADCSLRAYILPLPPCADRNCVFEGQETSFQRTARRYEKTGTP